MPHKLTPRARVRAPQQPAISPAPLPSVTRASAHNTWNRAASAEKRLRSNLGLICRAGETDREHPSLPTKLRGHSACAEDFSPRRPRAGGSGSERGRGPPGCETSGRFTELLSVVICLIKKIFIQILCQALTVLYFRDRLVNNTPRISPQET